jgi:hypothetical protein
VGYWTKDCEAWFQRRLEQIKDGTAKLYAPSGWKASLKFRPKVSNMARKNEALASSALDEMIWKAAV